MKKTLAAVLAALASLLLLAVRHLDRDGTAPVTPRATATAGPAARVETTRRDTTRRDTTPPDSHPAAQASRSLGDPALDAQVALVIDSMDRTGRSPDGVAQGGRKGGRRGTFQNAEGRLPTQPPGYYTESDVWPRAASGRGTHRLIFGRGGEVYYTADHYRTFVRVR